MTNLRYVSHNTLLDLLKLYVGLKFYNVNILFKFITPRFHLKPAVCIMQRHSETKLLALVVPLTL